MKYTVIEVTGGGIDRCTYDTIEEVLSAYRPWDSKPALREKLTQLELGDEMNLDGNTFVIAISGRMR